MSKHQDATFADIHITPNFFAADLVALAALSVTALDSYKTAWVESTSELYILDGSLAWVAIGGGTSSITHTVEDAVTNTVTTVVELQHNTTAVPVAGFGTGLVLQAESDTTENQPIAHIEAEYLDPTNASYQSAIKLYAYRNATKTIVGAIAANDGIVASTIPTIGYGGVDFQSHRTAATQTAQQDGGVVFGRTNTNEMKSSTIAGGQGNTITASAPATDYGSFIGAGVNNSLTGIYGVIGGGYRNSIVGDGNFVGGGQYNQTYTGAQYAVITGGDRNTTASRYSMIGGGILNDIGTTSNLSIIVGGYDNDIGNAATYNFIGGGRINTIGNNSTYNFIGDGKASNIGTYSDYNFIGGGLTNTVSNTSDFNFIGGGRLNTLTGNRSVIGGGYANIIGNVGTYVFIGAGQANTAYANHTAIVAGQSNSVSSGATHSFIGAGQSNSVVGSTHGVVVGGQSNTVSTNSNWAAVVGGYNNEATGDYAFIGAGKTNDITGDYGVIVGGSGNTLALVSNFSFIGAGQTNSMSVATHSFIGSGQNNSIASNFGTIGGGYDNDISNSTYGTIGGGKNNDITNSDYVFVGGGLNNIGFADNSVIGGGTSNRTDGILSFIGGGTGNTTSSTSSAIPGGRQAETNRYSEVAHAAGQFATQGDAQGTIQMVARRQVTHSDANWYELFLNGTSERITLQNDQLMTFDILIAGANSGLTETLTYRIEGAIENDGGTTTLLASTVTTISETTATFDARVTADNPNNALLVEVQDSAAGSDTIRWVATLRTAEVLYV